MRKIAIAALVLGLWAAALPTAEAAPTGTIEGTVVNGTEGGDAVAGVEVTLHIWQQNVEDNVELRTTRADSSGAFRFEGLETGAEYSYGVLVLYKDVNYWSELVQVTEDNPEAPAQVAVYEPTTSADDIKVILDHVALVVNQETQALEVWNVMQFENQGDRTYVGSEETTDDGTRLTLRFPLPKGATRIEPLQGLRLESLRLTEDGFADTEPLLPGVTENRFVYDLAYAEGELTFQKVIQYPTDKVSVMVPKGGVEVVSPDLSGREEADTESGVFTVLSEENLSAGASLQIEVSGIPGGGEGLALEDVLPPLTIALVIVALGAALGYPLIRRRMAVRGGEREQ